jgi:hypothetical protein
MNRIMPRRRERSQRAGGAGRALGIRARKTSEFAFGARPIRIENWSLKIGHWQLKTTVQLPMINFQFAILNCLQSAL